RRVKRFLSCCNQLSDLLGSHARFVILEESTQTQFLEKTGLGRFLQNDKKRSVVRCLQQDKT
ncbi:MAG TPA: hypothetical protein PK228_06645, partial [Saprospiraceae bacterium]|nr:hypothetical protein [Saprospiraceae bacterium]